MHLLEITSQKAKYRVEFIFPCCSFLMCFQIVWFAEKYNTYNELRVTSSDTRVTNSNLQVMSSNPRVTSPNR